MKTIKWIQNISAAIAFIIAITLVDGLGVTFKDICIATVLIVLAVSTLLGRALEEERRAE